MAGMERFTQRARRVLSLAYQEAERSKQSTIGTEHLLLGLINESGGVAGRALNALGISSDKLHNAVQQLTSPSIGFVPDKIELSDEVQQILDYSVDEARRMGHHYIGTEHIIFGLIQHENKATGFLKLFNITTDQIRYQVRKLLNEAIAPSSPVLPEISVSPNSGAIGENFLVEGNNFQTGEKVIIWIISPSKNEKRLQKEYTADNKGYFQFYLFQEIGFEQLEIGKWGIYAKDTRGNKTSNVYFEINTSLKLSRSLRVFLCHSSKDKSEVKKFYYQLKSTKSIDPWLDEEKLLPGQKWQVEIPKAVHNSDVILVFISKNSLDAVGYIQKEIRIALDVAEEQPEDSIFIIPARLEECKVPERLQQWQWVNLYETKGIERLFHSFYERAKHLGLLLD